MSAWFEGMTEKDMQKNIEEWKHQERRRARALRAEAAALLKEADEIDARVGTTYK